ncbi:hypothetical protein B0H66DRAFT_621392 [Apodospora peruviana]|uniref:Uncharacterized protein n=1 Tax=Apodospora peruviana TaxID=516989 RepID=A0AAE0HS05_9PEZI|nr:hypothetical protein B0H66DRAFT_618262 [Apodospora peruviana]KAK3317941.1 hypothetical protein B0H66DRAFT_621392 [Apodospora peruviana]
MALAKSLLFFADSSVLHEHKLLSVFKWFGILREDKRFRILETDHDDDIRTFVFFHNFMKSFALVVKRLDSIRTRRTEDHPYAGWYLSTLGARLEATDPEIMYSACLNSRISILSPTTPMTSRPPTYITNMPFSWLDAYNSRPVPSPNPTLPDHLFFLSFEGVGLFPEADHSSWIPNYPGCSGIGDLPSEWVMATPAAADRGLSSRCGSSSPEIPSITGTTPTVFCLPISPVMRREHVPGGVSNKTVAYFRDFVSRNRTYAPTAGTSGFQALFRVLFQDHDILNPARFEFRALYLWWDITGDSEEPVSLWISSNFGHRSRFLVLVKRLLGGARVEFEDIWHESLMADGTGVVSSRLTGDFEEKFKNGQYEMPNERDRRRLSAMEAGWRFMETENGLLGLSPKWTNPGDIVCVTKGSSYPVILRRSGNSWVHVGVCWVLGLMNGEAAESLGDERETLERFEII